MRIGSNPVRERHSAPTPARVTVSLLTHIPFHAGYHASSLDVLRLSLASLSHNTQVPHDILVFDNGSAPDVREFLVDELTAGRIEYLFLSATNIGKARAWNSMLAAAPGEFVAYADGDVFFGPQWLEKHLEVLEAFPDVGMVTGLPMRHLVNSYTDKGVEALRADNETVLESGDLLTEDAISAFCEGVGSDRENYMRQFGEIKDIRATRRGVSAFVGASHFQFVSPREVLAEILPLNSHADGGLLGKHELELDARVDRAQYLRLSTVDCVTHHLGNSLTNRWREVANSYGQHPRQPSTDRETSGRRVAARLSQQPRVKRWLLRLYDDIFWLYYVDAPKKKARARRARR